MKGIRVGDNVVAQISECVHVPELRYLLILEKYRIGRFCPFLREAGLLEQFQQSVAEDGELSGLLPNLLGMD